MYLGRSFRPNFLYLNFSYKVFCGFNIPYYLSKGNECMTTKIMHIENNNMLLNNEIFHDLIGSTLDHHIH